MSALRGDVRACSLAVAMLLSACGRIGFDPGIDASSSEGGDAVDATDRGDALVQPSAPVAVGFPAAGIEMTPTVGWDGAQFVVAWNDERGRPADPSIGGSLISTDMVVQPAALWLGGGFIVSQPPAVACNATAQCAIVVGNYSGSSALARVIVANGIPSNGGTLINRSSSFPGVASIGTSFAVVYNDGIAPGTFSVFIDSGGTLASVPSQLSAPVGGGQAATATTSRYLAVWEVGRVISYNVFDPSGVISGISQSVPGTANRRPAAASSPTVSLLVWIEMDASVRAARIAPDGTLIDPTPLTVSSASTAARPAVTWDGVSFLVAWERKVDAVTGYLAAAAVDPDTGAVGPEVPLTPSASPVTDFAPALASDGAGTSLLAFERQGANKAIYGLTIKR